MVNLPQLKYRKQHKKQLTKSANVIVTTLRFPQSQISKNPLDVHKNIQLYPIAKG